jgi:hypothetical protein
MPKLSFDRLVYNSMTYIQPTYSSYKFNDRFRKNMDIVERELDTKRKNSIMKNWLLRHCKLRVNKEDMHLFGRPLYFYYNIN